ncbi:MAG TPA: DUF1566 domain-containing protein [Leptospiraceae bacterium]|nr:DUF1566 domain-containing protein [Leptospiraceae bacterium]
MKKLMQYSFLSICLIILISCEAKPEKSYFGVPEEDGKQILAGLILGNGSIDNATGTVVDPKTGLEWKKCTQGQVFRSTNNDCQGSRATSTLTTPIDQGRYGATYLAYCNIEGNDCNTSSLPMALKSNTVTGVFSEAFLSCNTDRTNGYTNWRVPSYPELQALASLGKVVLTNRFPNTPDDYFWSSWSNEQDTSGKTARAVFFSLETIGKDQNISKTTRFYVRCVRNINGQ